MAGFHIFFKKFARRGIKRSVAANSKHSGLRLCSPGGNFAAARLYRAQSGERWLLALRMDYHPRRTLGGNKVVLNPRCRGKVNGQRALYPLARTGYTINFSLRQRHGKSEDSKTQHARCQSGAIPFARALVIIKN